MTHSHPSFLEPTRRNKLLRDVASLVGMHRRGELGGERMPEDVHPSLERESADLAHYFTLGMALNYQRNSYALWRSCTESFDDLGTRWIYRPVDVHRKSEDELRAALTRHRVALQPNNHVRIWRTIANSLVSEFEGDVRGLFSACSGRLSLIKNYIADRKPMYPYLGGVKICNYWLYVMLNYTDLGLTEKWALSVAPDTHVINASAVLGLVAESELGGALASAMVAERWQMLLAGTDIDPIDVHTPLWLWSRSGFVPIRGAR